MHETKNPDTKNTNSSIFHVSEIQSEPRKTIFVLDGSKNGCNQIVFDYNDNAELKSLMLTIFQQGKPFDFTIDKILPYGRCHIKAIRFPY